MTYKFTTIINKEGRWYVARCVELGVVSQGRTVKSAQANLKQAVELYLEDEPNAKKYFSKTPALIRILEIANG